MRCADFLRFFLSQCGHNVKDNRAADTPLASSHAAASGFFERTRGMKSLMYAFLDLPQGDLFTSTDHGVIGDRGICPMTVLGKAN